MKTLACLKCGISLPARGDECLCLCQLLLLKNWAVLIVIVSLVNAVDCNEERAMAGEHQFLGN